MTTRQTCWLCGRGGKLTATLTPGGMPAHDECVRRARHRIRQVTDAWNPLTPEQRDKLSLLLNPGPGRRGAA
jgi:hypothetical protein